jgi:uncharacterized phage-like protein YoqJ
MQTTLLRPITCAFSGYRPEKLPWGADETDPRCKRLKRKLRDIVDSLYVSGVRHYICGMARGADTYFCEAVLDMREQLRSGGRDVVTVEAAIPCETQARRWPEPDRERYNALVARCDKQTLISREYTPDCMQKRNKYMVDNSSVLVAVFDGKFGGTMSTRAYAAKRGLEIIDVSP